jgi:hypothetical protein
MYIIQTNISMNNAGVEVDFQSMMYKMPNETWEEFKKYILSDEYEIVNLIGTMVGSPKAKQRRVIEILINDDFHLEVEFDRNIKSKYYLVEDKAFNILK